MDLKNFFKNLNERFHLGSYITRLHVSGKQKKILKNSKKRLASQMLSEGDDWNDVFGEFSSAVRIFGDASFRDPDIYPLLRIFITNSDFTLYSGQNYDAMKASASELLFLQLNKDVVDYKMEKKTATVAYEKVQDRTITELKTTYNIIECPSMAEWGRESNSLLWNFLKAKAAQHNLKEVGNYDYLSSISSL
jgi:hypothetical protein